MLEKIKKSIISCILRFFMEGIGLTCRVRVVQGEKILRDIVLARKPVIFTYWHNRLFYLTYFLYRVSHKKGLRLSALISKSKDGDLITTVVESVHGKVIRGSSSKGGYSALKGLLSSIKEGYAPVTTPDGPRGPQYQFQAGTLYLSSMGKVPILPISCAFQKAWVFKSWDKFMVPKPFSKIYVSIGEPVQVGSLSSPEDIAGYQAKMEEIMQNLSSEFIDKSNKI